MLFLSGRFNLFKNSISFCVKENTKKFYISFKKPATIAESNTKRNTILKKIKSATKKQQQLEATAKLNNNSILNYVLPIKMQNNKKLSSEKETSSVDKESSNLEN